MAAIRTGKVRKRKSLAALNDTMGDYPSRPARQKCGWLGSSWTVQLFPKTWGKGLRVKIHKTAWRRGWGLKGWEGGWRVE